MRPSFNTTGPCIPGEHYMLPPGDRLGHILRLIDERKYFTLHAGHQTGKTTAARWLVKHYNAGDRYAAVWIDLQIAREEPEPAAAFRTILYKIQAAFARDLPSLPQPVPEDLLSDPRSVVLRTLRQLAQACPRPLVVLFDEADGLVGETLVSFLTQLRDGYLDRADVPFPHSVALIGRKEVRDFALSLKERRAVSWLGTSSPFNVTAEAVTLSEFTFEQVEDLLGQHTTHTGQRFLPEAVSRIFELSQGQPWLVNAMADQIVNRDVEDRAVPITAQHVDAAKETIILSRRTHIDALIARLREDRVMRVIQPMLVGDHILPYDELNDDFAYVMGLGLIRRRRGREEIANPIYKEVIPRVLSYDQQRQLQLRYERYLLPDGGLDMGRIMLAWQEFWREDGHLAAEGFRYREAGPHLMLMAFLQSLLNGRGRIEREYGLGRKALDLMLLWPDGAGPPRRYAIEVKLRRDERTLQKGVEQLAGYLDQCGLSEGWLVLFDLRKRRSWKERLTHRTRKLQGRRVHVIGC